GRDMPLLSGTQALWELEVRIHSLGFKELIGLLRTGQCATGTIVRAFRLTQIDSPPPSYATRHRLRNYLDGRWPSEQSGAPLSIGAQSQAAAIFKAVTLGDATAVDKHSWDLFQRTGTIHLLVISGLHLGFVAYLGAQILTWLLRRFGPIAFLWMPVAHWKWLGALISASAYAVIGGFSISVKRALAMLCIASIPFLLRRRMNYALLMLYALAGLLIMNPLHALIPGLWLSFGGVGALVLYTLTYRQNRVLTLTTSLSNEPDQPIRFMDRVLDPVLLFWGAQCAVLIVMLPLTALMSLPVSWLALPANLWAVPLMGWLAVPLSLVSFVLLPLSSFFIWIPLWVIQATLVGMEWVSTLWVPPLILNNPLTGVAWVWAALLFFSPHGFVCKKMWPVPLALCLIMPA
ncbi:MAG: ComEC/Rec2 family competence protein, partial [Gammaproteobacteria bacterium]